MSEYVFNSASNDPVNTTKAEGRALAATLVQTIAALDTGLGGPARPLKLPRDSWHLMIASDEQEGEISLGEIVNSFYDSGTTRELATFFDALQTYAPAVEQLEESSVDAILRLSPSGPIEGFESVYDAILAAGYDGMQCVVTGGTLVSLDHPAWDFDWAVFKCGNDRAEIDHASRPAHVDAIVDRWQLATRATVNRQNFEAVRGAAFPHLLWGRDVSRQLAVFPSEYLSLAFARLAALDDIVRRWRATGSIAPDSGNIQFRNESQLTMDNYGADRRFRSRTGQMQTYEKHVWIDRGNRIHLIVDQETRSVEIGYIGPHLRTWTN